MMLALQGRRIVVTRPAAQAGELARMIRAQGGEAVLFPLLEIGPADDAQPLQQAIARLDEYATAVFVSPNAVAFSVPHILARRAWPAGLRAAAIGPSTAVELRALGLAQILAPAQRFDSEALLALSEFQAGHVAGARVLILRGNGGRELLADTLRQRGAQVDCVMCYQRSPPAELTPLLSLLSAASLDALTVSSSEGLRTLVDRLDAGAAERWRRLPLFVPHQRIAEIAAELGWRRVVLTAPADAGILEGLCAYDWSSHE